MPTEIVLLFESTGNQKIVNEFFDNYGLHGLEFVVYADGSLSKSEILIGVYPEMNVSLLLRHLKDARYNERIGRYVLMVNDGDGFAQWMN